ncbi:LysM repeat protein [Saonia flava]|uniref:LysM repeat protein n=2 Tax=Saonia flava TaxID=523696 RepID=A0A846QW68_9FLAO|nr:LysM repeat protein [Saonia flava]
MPYKLVWIVTLLLLFSIHVSAQQNPIHKVKEGETLENIAKKYKVTPYNILSFNKEIKQGQTLLPNTILVIPLNPNATNEEVSGDAKTEEVVVVQQEPIGFTTHKVRKRETLFGIAQRYDVTQEDIKKYNKELYSIQLKKGMRLQIPKFPEVVLTEEELLNQQGFEVYTVQPKETRWSIAHRYGITIDSMLVLNPQLSKANDNLAEGQQLKLPRPEGVPEQVVQLYQSYTVPAKQTFYSLEKEFGVTSAELMKLNPEIGERGGLKEGMVLRIPQKKVSTAVVNTDNYIFYEVKPKQTEYSLTRNLDVTYRDLLDLNPELINGLKAGMILKLPKDKTGDLEVKNSLILDKINLLDSINTMNRPKLLVLLPFRLDRIDINDKDKATKILSKDRISKSVLGLYSGTLVALDSIKKLGISVDVKVFDTELSLNKSKEILLKENLMGVSAIIGPLNPHSLKEVAVQASNYQIPVISPIASESDISLSNVFFSKPADSILRDRMISYVENKRTDENIIVIYGVSHEASKNKILQHFPLASSIEISESEKNISLDIDKFKTFLSEEKENWVFVETDNFKVVSSVISILNSTNTEESKIRVFTTDYNSAFENNVISNTHLSNLNFCYPSVYRNAPNDSFVKMYRKRFGSTPDQYATRGFDLAYDLLLKLAYKNNLFEVSSVIGETEYTGNKFNYSKDLASGYFNTSSYIMKYEDMWVKEVKPE